MKFTPGKINLFSLLKIPLNWIAGVRVKKITDTEVVVKVKHRWINQNPFKSMFWAVQGMAAELSTGILVMKSIASSGEKVSMLVTEQKGSFTKKATGVITFVCNDGDMINSAIEKSAETGEGQVIILKSIGVNEEGIQVSQFEFQWSLKVKS